MITANDVIERFFGTLKYEHLFRGVIADGEVHRFRVIYNTIRPHQAIDDQVPSTASTGCEQLKTARYAVSVLALGHTSPST